MFDTIKITASSYNFLFVSIANLRLWKRTLNAMEVEPMYCKLHLIHEAK